MERSCKLPKEADAGSCLIEQVITPRVDFKRLIHTKSVHHASQTSFRLFEKAFRMNLRASEAMCCHKRQQVAEKYCIHIGKFILSKNNPLNAPRILNILSSPTSQTTPPQYCRRHRDAPCESTRVTSWYCYRYASWNVQKLQTNLNRVLLFLFLLVCMKSTLVWWRLNSSEQVHKNSSPSKLACTGLLVSFLPPPVLVTKPQLSLQRFWFELSLGRTVAALMAAL